MAEPDRQEPDRLASLVDRLEHTAAELRAGELSTDRAAALVDDCARIAAEAGAELDRRVRAGIEPHPPGVAGQLALEP